MVGGDIKIIFSEFITRFSLYLEKGVDSLFKKKKKNQTFSFLINLVSSK